MFVRYYLRVALLFAFFLVSIIITANASGYDSNRFNVIVMFKPGTVEFPVGVTEALPGEIYYSRSGIKEIMGHINRSSVNEEGVCYNSWRLSVCLYSFLNERRSNEILLHGITRYYASHRIDRRR
jgi:hypothetical protein